MPKKFPAVCCVHINCQSVTTRTCDAATNYFGNDVTAHVMHMWLKRSTANRN